MPENPAIQFCLRDKYPTMAMWALQLVVSHFSKKENKENIITQRTLISKTCSSEEHNFAGWPWSSNLVRKTAAQMQACIHLAGMETGCLQLPPPTVLPLTLLQAPTVLFLTVLAVSFLLLAQSSAPSLLYAIFTTLLPTVFTTLLL